MNFGHKHNRQTGRGANINPANRYAALNPVNDEDEPSFEESDTETRFYTDYPKKVLNKVDSPDIRMYYSVNPYQGCEHGCIYCYARNSHEYWGWSAGLDFESRIVIKKNAPELLKKEFDNPKWQPCPVSISGNTDCYQPVEKQTKITRQLLQVCLDYGNPVSLITKNAMILRDLDILEKLAAQKLVKVHFTVTTLDESLRRAMEPRTAHHKKRLQTIEKLSKAGVPVDLLLAPVIPGLNDHEIPNILKAVAEHGARSAGYTVVRLNGAIGEIFRNWLETHYPDRVDKVWNQVKACHGGKVNDSRWGTRIKGEGQIAMMIDNMFNVAKKRYLPDKEDFEFNYKAFCGPAAQKQLDLFQNFD